MTKTLYTDPAFISISDKKTSVLLVASDSVGFHHASSKFYQIYNTNQKFSNSFVSRLSEQIMKEQMLVSVQIDTSGVWNNALRKNSTHQLKMQDIDSMVAIPDSLYARTDADFIVAILNFYVTFIDDRTIRSSGSVVGSVDEYYITAWCSIIDRKTKKRVHLFYASGSKSCSSDCSDVLQRSITDCIERTVNYLD